MKEILSRLKGYHYSKNLVKNIFNKRRLGLWDKRSLKFIERCSNAILITFIIRFFSRFYIMYQEAGIDMSAFIHENYIVLLLWLFVYSFFVNYLIGIGNTDYKIKIYSTRYVKTLILIVLYTFEIFIGLNFFMNNIFDYKVVSIISLVSLIPSLISYVCIFLIVFDFIMYTTDNSDDIEKNKGDYIDYF